MKNSTLIEDYGVMIDDEFLDGLEIGDNYFSVPTDATVHLINDTIPYQRNFTSLPIHIDQGQEVQFILS